MFLLCLWLRQRMSVTPEESVGRVIKTWRQPGPNSVLLDIMDNLWGRLADYLCRSSAALHYCFVCQSDSGGSDNTRRCFRNFWPL